MFFRRKSQRILRKHQQLGYPEFSKEDQLDMVINNDFSKIQALTGDKLLPLAVLDHYIHLTEQDVFDQIQIDMLLKNYELSNEARNQGIVITSNNSPYKVLWKDRGYVQQGWDLDEVSLKDFFTKLLLSEVPKYAYLNPL